MFIQNFWWSKFSLKFHKFFYHNYSFVHAMQKKILALTLFVSAIVFTGAGCLSLTQGEEPQTTGPGGIFLSLDKGETWKSSSVFPTVEGAKTLQGASVFQLVDDPSDPNTFYWASRGNGLFYTTDGAKSWQRAIAPLNTGFMYAVAVHPKDHCTVFVSTGSNVYRSNDCLRSWSQVYREEKADSIQSIAVNPFSPLEVVMAKSSGDVLVSKDGGVAWQVLKRSAGAQWLMVSYDTNTEGRMYLVSQSKGLFRSDDNGTTWKDLSKPLKKYASALKYRSMHVYTSKKDVLYWISQYGILRSENAGESWVPFTLINSPGSVKIYGFAVNPQNEKEIFYTATIGIRSTLYKSVDGGKNWIAKKLPSGQIPTKLRIEPNSENLFLGFTIPPKK